MSKITRSNLVLLLLFISVAVASVKAEEKQAAAFGINFSGFVKTDIFYDSRQTVSIREGHFLLYPKGPSLDPAGRDINAHPSFHLVSIQTRLIGRISGPDALGAKTSAYIETEFFGTSENDLNGFRLRHAFLKFNWRKTELMVGQFWHPLFITDSFPEVVSFNTGAPFQPFNRSPQVRLTRFFDNFSLSATVLSQRDFVSTGPEGPGSVYFRNAALPEMNVRIQWSKINSDRKTETSAGASLNFLKIVPRIKTETGYAADESLNSLAGLVFFKQKWPAVTLKVEAIYGQNLHHLTMMGGYGASQVLDEIKRSWSYSPLRTFSTWAEILTNGKIWQTGLFLGYSRNLGSKEAIPIAVYSRGVDVGSLYRIAPRLIFNAGKARFAAETEWTSAAFGTPDRFGKVSQARHCGNFRLLLAAYYFF